MKKIAMITLAAVLITTPVAAKRNHPERWYQDQWCAASNGRTEVVMQNGSRCDCLTENNAIEFDFGSKFQEAGFQAMEYAMYTGKRAGIVLIMEHEKDLRFWNRLQAVINHYNLPIDTWPIRAWKNKESTDAK